MEDEFIDTEKSVVGQEVQRIQARFLADLSPVPLCSFANRVPITVLVSCTE